MNFAKDFPEKLRSSILLSEVIGKKVRLKKQGKDFLGLCPFHNEKTPSFHVNDHKGFYHCFGCQAHGDIITFTMENERLEFKEAIFKLASDFGIEVPIITSNQPAPNYVARDFLIIEKIAQFFQSNLYQEQNHEARAYLKKRGFNSAIAKKFHIGYAPNSYEALLKYLKNLDFSDSEIASCGVIGKNDNGKFYDKFRNRVTFAIADKKNRLIAFGGRSLGVEMPKYLNSAETEIFKKNQTLYNFFNARKAIFDKGFAIMVEGYIDVITLAINGFENVVAGLGTAISDNHLQQLFSITDKIIICLDGDNAGIKAAKRVLEMSLPIINSQKNLAFCFLPNQMDPDDFIKNHGTQEFQKILDKATPLSQALFDFTMMDLGLKTNQKLAPENKARLELELQNKINLITDNSTKKYFNLFAKDSLFMLGRFTKKALPNHNSNLIISKKNNNIDKISLTIIALLIKFPQLVNYRDKEFDIRDLEFIDNQMTDLKEFIINLIDENHQNIIEELEKSDFKLYIGAIKAIVKQQGSNDIDVNKKFRIELLKDLYLKVDKQYKENLDLNLDLIGADKIFEYKDAIKAEIKALQSEESKGNGDSINIDAGYYITESRK